MDVELFREYDEIIEKQIDTRIVEEVPENASCTPQNVHYLPHHPTLPPGIQVLNVSFFLFILHLLALKESILMKNFVH